MLELPEATFPSKERKTICENNEKARAIRSYFINAISCCCCLVTAMSISLPPRGLEPDRLLCPWDFPGKNTNGSCHFFLWGIFLTQGLNPCLLCLLHWQADAVPLHHLRSPITVISVVKVILYSFLLVWLFQSYTERISSMKKGTLAVTLKTYPQGLEQWHSLKIC